MKQLSLDNLRTFVGVIEQGGYAKAGEWLGRSQPAISLQIKKLEEQLDKKLFTKVGQRHVPSIDGQWLYPKAKEMLALNDAIFRQLHPTPLRGRLRLGIPNEFASTLLPGLIGEFSKRYPDVSLEVTSALSRDLLSPAQRKNFDLILALINPETDTDGQLVIEDEMVWVGDARYPGHRLLIEFSVGPRWLYLSQQGDFSAQTTNTRVENQLYQCRLVGYCSGHSTRAWLYRAGKIEHAQYTTRT